MTLPVTAAATGADAPASMPAPASPALSRRTALRTAGLLGLTAAATMPGLLLDVAPAAAAPLATTPTPIPWRRRKRSRRPVLDVPHLLRRTTFGITPELLADVQAAGGASGWLDRQLTPYSIDDSQCDEALRRWPLAHATPPAVHAAMGFGDWDAMQELVESTLARQLWSKRQLLEVMVDFWSNHLNITAPSSEVWATKPEDDRLVVRRHALGRFEDMLLASMTSPAMLQYLNGAESTGTDPNENHGRELLELHSLGVDAGYTHADVVDAARALTGLSVYTPWNGGTSSTYGTLMYRPERHYVGALKVLGWTHSNSTADGGLAVVRSLGSYLARHPATARRIATKLAVRFVSDTPPAALVDRLAAAYLSNGTAIVPVLRLLLASPEFGASKGQKTRRPAEDLIATARALRVQPAPSSTDRRGIQDLVWNLQETGNAPLGWGLPDGYPDVAPAWTGPGQMLSRWNLHIGVAQGWFTGGLSLAPNLAQALLGPAPASRGALVDQLFARLMPGQPVPAAQRAAMISFLGNDGPLQDGDLTWLFPVIVGLVLDSPLWSQR